MLQRVGGCAACTRDASFHRQRTGFVLHRMFDCPTLASAARRHANSGAGQTQEAMHDA
jgi:hypothetical protein